MSKPPAASLVVITRFLLHVTLLLPDATICRREVYDNCDKMPSVVIYEY